MMVRRVPGVLSPLLAVLFFGGCGGKEYNLAKLFRGTPLVERLEGLKPSQPPRVRRKNAEWFLENAHKLSDEKKKIILPLLAELLLKDQDRLIRGYAAATLGRLRDPAGVPALVEALKNDKYALVRCDVIKAIAQYKDGALIPELTRAAQTDRDADVRQAAIAAIAELGGKEAVPTLIDALGDRDTNVVFTASQYLANLTGQNLGLSQKAWRDWWQENAEKPMPSEGPPPKKKKKK